MGNVLVLIGGVALLVLASFDVLATTVTLGTRAGLFTRRVLGSSWRGLLWVGMVDRPDPEFGSARPAAHLSRGQSVGRPAFSWRWSAFRSSCTSGAFPVCSAGRLPLRCRAVLTRPTWLNA